jgi:hypothetical protein
MRGATAINYLRCDNLQTAGITQSGRRPLALGLNSRPVTERGERGTGLRFGMGIFAKTMTPVAACGSGRDRLITGTSVAE